MRKLLFIAIVAFTASAAYAEPVVEVLKIAGKSESEVASYLGTPKSCGKSKYGNKCQYTKGETEIVSQIQPASATGGLIPENT